MDSLHEVPVLVAMLRGINDAIFVCYGIMTKVTGGHTDKPVVCFRRRK
jgi:hypothetical protein